MSTSWRLPSREAFGELSFLDSDYFKDRIRKLLPDSDLDTPVADLGVLPAEVAKSLGEHFTLGSVLSMSLTEFAEKTNLERTEAKKARNKLLLRSR